MSHIGVFDTAVQYLVVATTAPLYIIGATNNWSWFVMALILVPLATILLNPYIGSTFAYGIADVIKSLRDSTSPRAHSQDD